MLGPEVPWRARCAAHIDTERRIAPTLWHWSVAQLATTSHISHTLTYFCLTFSRRTAAQQCQVGARVSNTSSGPISRLSALLIQISEKLLTVPAHLGRISWRQNIHECAHEYKKINNRLTWKAFSSWNVFWISIFLKYRLCRYFSNIYY